MTGTRGPARIQLPRDEIIKAYRDGVSSSALAQQYGVSRRVLARRLDDWRVERRGRAEANRIANQRREPVAATRTEPVPGDPDGYGRWARLDIGDDGETLLCHECGAWKRAVGTHAWYIHGITAAQYRERHGLSTGQSLAAPATQQRFSAMPQTQPGSAGRHALDVHRDPDRARAAMTREGQHRPQLTATRAQTASRARRGRPLAAVEIDALKHAAGDVPVWTQVAQQLVDDGVSQAEISRATGVPTPTVSQRLRRRR